MTLYVEKPKDSTKRLLKLTKKLSKVAGYKINIQKSVVSITTSYQTEKLSNPIYNGIKKNKLLRNKFNQGGETPIFQKLLRHL